MHVLARAALGASIVLGATIACADVTGSYTGRFEVGHPPQTVDVAAVLADASGTLTGTVVLAANDPTLAGAYLVGGRLRGRHVRLRGSNPAGAQILLRAVVASSTLRGKARVRMGTSRTTGRIRLTRLVAGGDGSECDAVFTQNEEFFTTQVMDGVLVPTCSACHVQGGQAAATRLRVVPGDPAATARSSTLVVDQANPAGSLLLAKPLALVPHGGGQQIAVGSDEARVLGQWVDLVAQADCVVPPANTGPELYAAHCAGCHGADGEGGAGSDVRCSVRSLVTDAVRRGRGSGDTGMPAFPTSQLSTDQLGLITDHLGGLCSGLPRDVYASNCATCHGSTAGGGRNADGVVGPNIRCTESGDFGEALREGEERMPAFPSLAAKAGRLAGYVRGFCGLGGGD